MTMGLGDYTPGCNTTNGQMTGAILTGVAMRMTNLDTLFPLPPIVHTALGGLTFDYMCRMSAFQFDQRAMKMAGYSVGGGFLPGIFMMR